MTSALREFEAFASTRIRTNGAQNDRRTGNFAAALFTHDTSRALDPHLHTHCIVFNASFDAVENRWKALQNYELLRARKFAENAYYHELARELRMFGYRIRNLPRGDFLVEGIPTELCDRFSKRDAEIDKALAKLLAEKPELAGGNIADLRARLATEKRTRKQKDLSRDELRVLWDAQLSQSERELLRGLSKGIGGDAQQREAVPVVVAFACGIGCMAICCGSVAVWQIISAASNSLVAITINPLKPMSTKSPECWASDPNARAVKIEVSAEQSLLLPFDQFAFAELKSDGKEQRLRLVFATHEVTLRGHSLRRIETGMQRMELTFLMALPDSLRALVTEGQPVLREIVVTETERQQSRPPGGAK